MRNLKRVLSLAMASVMLLGMMVIGAGAANKTAADLTDLDKVVNKEAVTLMVDLGIIVGKPDGSYAPTETIDRATMSKLIYFIMMGNTDESAFKGISTPLTDVKGNWAEGFINYCYSMKIVAGTGDNTYNPNGKVTTVSAAKMLLVALGYDAKLSKYENDAMWSINIMRDAQNAGLLNKVGQKASDELTRDNAAQMIYNALFAKTVLPETERDMGSVYLKKYVANPTTLGLETYGLVKAVVSVGAITAGTPSTTFSSSTPKNEDTVAANVNAFKGKVVTDANKLTYTADMVGANAAIYVKATYTVADGKVSLTYDKSYSSAPVAAATTILGTSTNGTVVKDTSWATDDADLVTKRSDNKSFIAELQANTTTPTDAAVKVFLNGVDNTSAIQVNTLAGFNMSAAANTAVAKRGTVVDLIDGDDDGKVDIIKITEKTVYTLSGDASTKTVGSEVQVRIPGFISSFSSTNTTENVIGHEGLEKGDVILVANLGGIRYIEKAKSIEGVVAGTDNSGNPKIDGTTYKLSQQANASSDWASDSTKDYTNTWKFYLDNGNYVVKAIKVTDEDVTGDYAVVVGKQDITGDLNTGSSIQIKLLMSDGTTVVGNVNKIDGVKPVNAAAVAANIFYTYTITDKGTYDLKVVTGTKNLSSDAINNGEKKFADADTTVLGSENTVFVVAVTDSDGTTYKAYTGISKVPSMSAATGKVISKDGLATLVYLQVNASAISGIDSDAEYFYIPKNTSYSYYPKTSSNSNEYYEYTAYKNGDKTTVKVNATGKALIDGNNDAIFKASTLTDNGVYTNVTKLTEGTGFVTVANGGTLTVSGDANVYSYNSDTKVYIINSDKELSVSALKVDETDTVTVIADNKVAKIVFVRETISNANAVTGATLTINGADVDASRLSSGSATGITLDTITTGQKLVIKPAVSAGAKYTVSPATYTAVNGNTSAVFNITVTAENGDVAVATYTVTFTAHVDVP